MQISVTEYLKRYSRKTKKGSVQITNYNATSHALARELLSKPDGYITAMCGDKEYVIGNTKRVATHANIDDSVMHWTLQLKECEGNIIR